MIQKILKTCAVFIAITLISACASSPKTQVVQIGDTNLSREQIVAELQKLNETEKKIADNKGVTGTNVASFLLWWPGLAYTYYDASEASKLIEQRRSHLNSLYNGLDSKNTPSVA